jgi:hypothetical protein
MQEYIITDRQLHWLSQVIAKVNRSFVPAEKDDSHTNLYFEKIRKGIYGRWISTPAGKVILFLDLDSLSFQWLDLKKVILSEFSVYNADLKELERKAGEFLNKLGMDTAQLSAPLDFDLPDYGIQKLEKENFSENGLKSWMYYREIANLACFDIMGYVQITDEIRIWPHHFDTGIYTPLTEHFGLGFGLAMEDSMVGEPYFYLSGYASDSEINYSDPGNLSAGRWETEASWKGAVLPLSDLPFSSDIGALEKIRRFIEEATTWYFKAL